MKPNLLSVLQELTAVIGYEFSEFDLAACSPRFQKAVKQAREMLDREATARERLRTTGRLEKAGQL